MDEIMHKFKAGTLRSGSGERVRSREQAIAIGMSYGGKKKKKGLREHMHELKMAGKFKKG